MEQTEKMKKMLSLLLNTGYMEIEQLLEIFEYQPFIIVASLEIASELSCAVDWSIIIKALSILTKDSIDYGQIQKEISFKNPNLYSGTILDEIEVLKEYIESINIDTNGCAWGEIAYSLDSEYSETGEYFKELITNRMTLDEFYDNVSNIITENIKNKTIKDHSSNMQPIAIYTISNNASILIYEIDHFNEKILVGSSTEDAMWYDLKDSTFLYGEIKFSLEDFLRI